VKGGPAALDPPSETAIRTARRLWQSSRNVAVSW
jgi:hypothetical protein